MDWFLYDWDLRHESVKKTHIPNCLLDAKCDLIFSTSMVNDERDIVLTTPTKGETFFMGFHIKIAVMKMEENETIFGKTTGWSLEKKSISILLITCSIGQFLNTLAHILMRKIETWIYDKKTILFYTP